MIKVTLLVVLGINTLFALDSSLTIAPKETFYLKDGRKIYKVMKPTIYKPMKNEVTAYEYKNPIIKGILYDYKK